jgi:hypothetical protein
MQLDKGDTKWHRSLIDWSHVSLSDTILFQRSIHGHWSTGRTVMICSVLGFTSLHCVPKQTLVNGVFIHTMLPEDGIMLVKTDPWLPRLTLSWVTAQFHSCKLLQSLGYSQAYAIEVMQVKTWVHPIKAWVFAYFQGNPRALCVNTGPDTDMLPKIGDNPLVTKADAKMDYTWFS